MKEITLILKKIYNQFVFIGKHS